MNTKTVKTVETKTAAEVEALKTEWLAFPDWELEDMEGFEAHRIELLEFRERHRMIWDIAAFKQVETECNRLGCSPAMLSRFKFLESRLDSLTEELDKLQNPD